MHPTSAKLIRLLEGDLGPPEISLLFEHIDDCSACRRALNEFEEVLGLLRGAPSFPLPSGMEERLHQRLALPDCKPLPVRAGWSRPRARLLSWVTAVGVSVALVGITLHALVLGPPVKQLPSEAHHAQSPPRPSVTPGLRPPSRPLIASRPPTGGPVLSARGPAPASTVPVPVAPLQAPISAQRPAATLAARPGPQPAVAPPAIKPPVEGAGRLLMVSGQPVISGDGARAQQVAVSGGLLSPGQSLTSGELDYAALVLPDGAQVTTSFDTSLQLMKPRETGGRRASQLKLTRGKVWIWAPGDGQGIELQTPNGSLALGRGEAVVETRTWASGERAGQLCTVLASRRGLPRFRTAESETTIPAGQAMAFFDNGEPATSAPQLLAEVTRSGARLGGTERVPWVAPTLSRDALLRLVSAPRAELGLRVAPPEQQSGGLPLLGAEAGTPLALAGLKPGDILVTLNGTAMRSSGDLLRFELREGLAGGRHTVSAVIRRGVQELPLTLVISTRPATPAWSAESSSQMEKAIRQMVEDDLAEARATLIELTAEEANSAAAYYNLGLLYDYQREPRAAAAAYHEALRLRPDEAEVLTAYGRALLGVGNVSGAAARLRQALGSDENSVSARYLLGYALLLGGDPDGAQAQGGRLLKLPGGVTSGHLLLGEVADMRGRSEDLGEAAMQYQLALEQEPSNSGAALSLASVQFSLGNTEEARRIAEQVYERGSADGGGSAARAASLIGSIYRLAGQYYPQAESWTLRSLELEPGSATDLCNLAFIYHATKDYPKAEHYYQEAIRYGPSLGLARTDYALLLESMGRPAEAKEQYLAALQLDPGDQPALGFLLQLCQETGDQTLAQTLEQRYQMDG